MGLSITAYSGLVREENQSNDREDYNIKIYINPSFPRWCSDIKEGYYTAEKEFGFRAGSYSGYSNWREQLAQLAGYVSARAVWNDPQPGAFMELINFSDCEGTIGTAVSAKLAKDFANFQNDADAHPDEHFREKYALWRQAFELAANAGAVKFH